MMWGCGLGGPCGDEQLPEHPGSQQIRRAFLTCAPPARSTALLRAFPHETRTARCCLARVRTPGR